MASYIERLGQQFLAAGGKKLSEGGTVAGNIAALNATEIGSQIGFHPIGSLAGDIIRTAAPGIAIAAAGIAPVIATKIPGGSKTVAGIEDLFYANFLGQGVNDVSNAMLAQSPTGPAGLPVPVQNPSMLDQILRGVGGILSQAGGGFETFGKGGLFQGTGTATKGRRCKHPTLTPSAPGSSLMIAKCPPRRMNALNPRALRRATSRISAFHRFAVAAEKQMAAAFRKGGFHAPRRASTKCATCRKTRCSC